jgi:hypothetical protein
VKVPKAVLNIYSAVTIYFYLDADPPAGQVSDSLENEISRAKAARTDGRNPTQGYLSRGFEAYKSCGLEAHMKN